MDLPPNLCMILLFLWTKGLHDTNIFQDKNKIPTSTDPRFKFI
uniref:Uncharacterized protein n=1 Tax=Arundo donax TaxID=35708 RepID=A0A0A9AU68_ARUDO